MAGDEDAERDQAPHLDAATLTGLLADDDRLHVVAALALGASDLAAVRTATGLELAASVRAVQRLIDAGLLERGDDGTLTLLTSAFRVAARYEGRRRALTAGGDGMDGLGGVPPDEARVLRSFLRDGRLTHIPAQHSKRVVVLGHLAEQFEPGRRYSEKMVNLVLGRFHPDTAALRRYLVDYGFLDRDHGEYWRSGGHVQL